MKRIKPHFNNNNIDISAGILLFCINKQEAQALDTAVASNSGSKDEGFIPFNKNLDPLCEYQSPHSGFLL